MGLSLGWGWMGGWNWGHSLVPTNTGRRNTHRVIACPHPTFPYIVDKVSGDNLPALRVLGDLIGVKCQVFDDC